MTPGPSGAPAGSSTSVMDDAAMPRPARVPPPGVTLRLVEGRERARHLLLILPLAVLLGLGFVYPLGRLLVRSVAEPTWTLDHYRAVVTGSAHLRVLWTTFRTATTVTLVCLVFGYPVAYVLVGIRPRAATVLLVCILTPFWTSLVIRTYAWMVLFQRNGLVNGLLQWLGVIHAPLPLMYNAFGVHVGMVHILLPFMILPLYAVMRGIDPTLMRAAESLGARPWRTFWEVFWPLSLSGVTAGLILVFILALGFFVTPALLGGPKDMMVAVLIEQYTSLTLNWALASALSAVLLGITVACYLVYDRILGAAHVLGEAIR